MYSHPHLHSYVPAERSHHLPSSLLALYLSPLLSSHLLPLPAKASNAIVLSISSPLINKTSLSFSFVFPFPFPFPYLAPDLKLLTIFPARRDVRDGLEEVGNCRIYADFPIASWRVVSIRGHVVVVVVVVMVRGD